MTKRTLLIVLTFSTFYWCSLVIGKLFDCHWEFYFDFNTYLQVNPCGYASLCRSKILYLVRTFGLPEADLPPGFSVAEMDDDILRLLSSYHWPYQRTPKYTLPCIKDDMDCWPVYKVWMRKACEKVFAAKPDMILPTIPLLLTGDKYKPAKRQFLPNVHHFKKSKELWHNFWRLWFTANYTGDNLKFQGATHKQKNYKFVCPHPADDEYSQILMHDELKIPYDPLETHRYAAVRLKQYVFRSFACQTVRFRLNKIYRTWNNSKLCGEGTVAHRFIMGLNSSTKSPPMGIIPPADRGTGSPDDFNNYCKIHQPEQYPKDNQVIDSQEKDWWETGFLLNEDGNE